LSSEEKYAVSKRRKQIGTFTARQIIQLLKIRELSTIHKVKLEAKEITIGEFVSAHNSGELPEQNIAEPTPEETKSKATKSKRSDMTTPKAPPPSVPPARPKTPSSSPPLNPKPHSADPVCPEKGESPKAPATTGILPESQRKSNEFKPDRSTELKEGFEQTLSRKRTVGNRSTKKIRLRSYQNQKSKNPIVRGFGLVLSLIRKALLIGTFIVLAYVGASLFNHHKMKGEIESSLKQSSPIDDIEVTNFTLDGYYLIDDPRKATVEVLRKGEEISYEFKVTGNGITSAVKLEMK